MTGSPRLFAIRWVRSNLSQWITKLFLIYFCNPQKSFHTSPTRIIDTMKLWHWKSHWKSRVTLKNLGTKEMSNTENFSVWLKIFQCDFNVLEQQRKIFQWDNPGLSLWFPLLIFFSVVSMAFKCHKNFQCDFQCQNFIVRAANHSSNSTIAFAKNSTYSCNFL